MSTCDVEVSVSSWAAVVSAVTFTVSDAVAMSRLMSTWVGAAERTSDGAMHGPESLGLDVQLVGIEGHVEELEGTLVGGGRSPPGSP